MTRTKSILIVAAHPDDEVLGCGGTIAKSVDRGATVYTLILGEGPTSRFDKKKKDSQRKELKELKTSISNAAKVLGVKKTFLFNFPDNKFDTVPLLDIVKTIEKVKNSLKPDIIYTHYKGDLNIDHRITYDAVLTACRPLKDETVREIYSFEIPSSTEWSLSGVFNPNIFIAIEETIDRKLKALKMYKVEARKYPHPRSEEAVKIIAKRWGSTVGLSHAEAFETVRIIR